MRLAKREEETWMHWCSLRSRCMTRDSFEKTQNSERKRKAKMAKKLFRFTKKLGLHFISFLLLSSSVLVGIHASFHIPLAIHKSNWLNPNRMSVYPIDDRDTDGSEPSQLRTNQVISHCLPLLPYPFPVRIGIIPSESRYRTYSNSKIQRHLMTYVTKNWPAKKNK